MVKSTSLVLVLSAVLAMMLGNVQCQVKCRENEELKNCPGCRKTCEDVTNMSPPRMCSMVCTQTPACECKTGYVLDSSKRCVPEKECPCLDNATFKGCGTACPLTCENYSNPPGCTDQCMPGCFCKDGYVKSSDTGPCVLVKDCTKSSTK